jgi:hypothetical protein
MSVTEKLAPQFGEVLDNPVVDHGDLARTVHVRVGVGIVGYPVGSPSGMADPSGALRQRLGAEQAFEVHQLASLLARHQERVGHHGDSRRVVPAVLESAKSGDDDR